MTRLTRLIVSGVALSAGAPSAHAQILEEWRLLHSDSAFDYLATDRGFGHVSTDLDGSKIHRAVISRMLVRFVDVARADQIRRRVDAGRATAGYEAWASSTFVLRIRCTTKSVWATETVDHADDGTVLDRRTAEPGITQPPEDWSAAAMEAVTNWACLKASGRTVRGSVGLLPGDRPEPAVPGWRAPALLPSAVRGGHATRRHDPFH